MIEFWAFLEDRVARTVDRAFVACEIKKLKMTPRCLAQTPRKIEVGIGFGRSRTRKRMPGTQFSTLEV